MDIYCDKTGKKNLPKVVSFYYYVLCKYVNSDPTTIINEKTNVDKHGI